MAGSQGLVLVPIDGPSNGEHGGGDDRLSLTTSLPKNGQKKGKSMMKVGAVAGDNSGSDGQRVWSQNVGRLVGNVSGVIFDGDWPENG